MTGFKPRTSGIRSNRSTNWATTTARIILFILLSFKSFFSLPNFCSCIYFFSLSLSLVLPLFVFLFVQNAPNSVVALYWAWVNRVQMTTKDIWAVEDRALSSFCSRWPILFMLNHVIGYFTVSMTKASGLLASI